MSLVITLQDLILVMEKFPWLLRYFRDSYWLKLLNDNSTQTDILYIKNKTYLVWQKNLNFIFKILATHFILFRSKIPNPCLTMLTRIRAKRC